MKDWWSPAALALVLVAWWGSPSGTQAPAEKGEPASVKASPSPSPSPSPTAVPAFVDTTAPVLRVKRGTEAEPVAVFVSNTGRADFDGAVTVVLRTARGRAIPPTRVDCKVPSGEVAHRLELTANVGTLQPEDYPLRGWLILSPSAPDKPVVKLEIKALPGSIGTKDWALIRGSSILAMVCMAVAAVACMWTRRSPMVLLARMGSPTWDFTQSWSSTLTVVGAGLAALFAYTGLPEYGRHFGKGTYVLLSMVFAALIGLAPAVYSLYRVPVQSKTTEGTLQVQYRGLVMLFLAAGVLTMTGVFAQLSLLRFLFDDLGVAGLLSGATAGGLRWLCLVLEGALALYAVVSARQAILKQSVSEKVGEQPALRRAGIQADTTRVPHALPDWPLL